MLNVICPVGPIDYRYFAAEVNKRGLSCRNLRMINMDEYIGEDGELIPESQRDGDTDIATLSTMVGFAVMMTLDVALG